ncbi:MAG: hypothetical protein H0V22_08145 [Solirubrobacterales bacterium]|nr:hypothetical protein [Solirubrobacterales bacterium]
MGKGLLFSQMEPPPDWEADFHDWYETEHIPVRMAVPGFHSAWRYEAIDGEPRWLACYFLDNMGALELPEYRSLKSDPSERTARMLANVRGFTRYLCDQLLDTGESSDEVGALFAVAFSVPDEAAGRFDAWYEDEHVPMLMKADGWLRVRRYRARPGGDGPPWTHFALHELRDPEVMHAPEREAARATPRRAELAAEPWFSPNGRWLYRPIHTAHAVPRNGG